MLLDSHQSASLALFFFCLDLFGKLSDIGRWAGLSVFKFPLQFSYPFLVRHRPIFYLGNVVLSRQQLGFGGSCVLDRLQNLLSLEMGLLPDHVLVRKHFQTQARRLSQEIVNAILGQSISIFLKTDGGAQDLG